MLTLVLTKIDQYSFNSIITPEVKETLRFIAIVSFIEVEAAMGGARNERRREIPNM